MDWHIQKLTTKPKMMHISLFFFQKFGISTFYTEVYHPVCVNFCIRCEVFVKVFFFCMYILKSFSTICWKDYTFSIELTLYLVKTESVSRVFCFIDLCVYPFANSTLYYCSFIVNFKIEQYDSSRSLSLSVSLSHIYM